LKISCSICPDEISITPILTAQNLPAKSPCQASCSAKAFLEREGNTNSSRNVHGETGRGGGKVVENIWENMVFDMF